MAATPTQTFTTHARYVPGFHFFAGGIFVINFLYALLRIIRTPSLDAGITLLLASGLLSLFYYARAFAVAVQDRVIRLEERLRYDQVLPAELRGRIEEFSRGQLIALRFASDAELPILAGTVLNENVREQKRIKRMIRDWKPDHWRA
jgi:Family of unknown function (DUF6526)